MARKADFDAKISALEEKINQKAATLKELKNQLNEVKSKQEAERMKDLVSFMNEHDLSSSRALELIQKGLEAEQQEQPQENAPAE